MAVEGVDGAEAVAVDDLEFEGSVMNNRDRIEREVKKKFYVDGRQWGVPVDGTASLPDLQFQHAAQRGTGCSQLNFFHERRLSLGLTGVEYTNKWAGSYFHLKGGCSATRDMSRYDNCPENTH